MDLTVTKKQVDVLELIEAFRTSRGYSPTLREIASDLGVSSVATVAQHIDSLESAALVRRRKDRARSIVPTQRGRSLLESRVSKTGPGANVVPVPLLGLIAAGEPIEALPTGDEIDVPAALAAGRRVYALQVSGTSMIDEGIFDGDYVVVEEKQVPENGETVVALIDGSQATLKKFYRETTDEGPRIRLQPANASMQPIIVGPDQTLEVQGRVRGVLRIY